MATWKGNVALLRRRTNWDDPASTRKTFSLNKHGHLFVTCLMILYRMAIFVGLMSSYGWQKKSVPHTQQGKGFVATIPIHFWICRKKLYYIRIFTHEKLPEFCEFCHQKWGICRRWFIRLHHVKGKRQNVWKTIKKPWNPWSYYFAGIFQKKHVKKSLYEPTVIQNKTTIL